MGAKSLPVHAEAAYCEELLLDAPKFTVTMDAVLCRSIRAKSVVSGVIPLYIDLLM